MGDRQVKTSFWARIPSWAKDLVGIAFFLLVFIVNARSEIRETGEVSSLAIPVMLLLYVLYRVGRRMLKGSAYPERKPGEHRSFQLTSKR